MQLLSRWSSLAVVLTFAGQVRGADAQPPAQRDAQTRFDEGLERVRAGDYEAARISFEQAYAVIKRPSVLWNLALAEEKTGHLVDALTHFKRLAVEPAAAVADRENARRHASALRTQTGHIEIQAPAGAILRVDADVNAGVAPLADAVDVLPGHHVVQARLSDGSQSSPVDLAAGQLVKVSFGLPAAPSGPLPSSGSSPSSSGPTSAGAIGPRAMSSNTSLGNTSSERAGVAPSAGVSAADREPANAAPDASGSRPLWRPQTVTAVVLGGAAAAAFGFGVYFAIKSHDDSTNAANIRRGVGPNACSGSGSVDCADLKNAVRSQNREATASDVLYVAAGALAIGALAAVVFWPNTAPSASAWLAPVIGPGTAGVMGGGAF